MATALMTNYFDAHLCDMPLFPEDVSDDRFAMNFWDLSPPDSPAYSLSDASAEYEMSSAHTFVDVHALLESPDEAATAVMWSGDLFLGGSAWSPTSSSEFSELFENGMAMDGSSSSSPADSRTSSPAKLSKKRKASAYVPRTPKKERLQEATPAGTTLSRSSSVDSDEPECKRNTHNVLERKRRNDLKMSYQQLREAIPALAANERAPTGQILLHAVEAIAAMVADEARLAAELEVARADVARLRCVYAL